MTDDLAKAEAPLVPDLLQVGVPVGWRVLVVSDLHFGRAATPTSTATANHLAEELDAWAGPGIVVFAGDVFELLGDQTTDPGRALDAHPRLNESLGRWCRDDGRSLVVLAGNHDGALAWHEPAVRLLAKRFGASVALAVELAVDTGTAVRRVRVEHGNRFDGANCFRDPRNPLDSPLGQHIVTDLLPTLEGGGTSWLEGIEHLADPVDAPTFVASRIAYRRVARYLWWLVLPLLVVLGLRLGFRAANAVGHRPGGRFLSGWASEVTVVTIAVLADLALVAAGLAIVGRRAFAAVSQLGLGERGLAQNDAARAEAGRLADHGVSGLVTGHTHHPELSDLRTAFYANCGCGSEVQERRRARWGLPPVFASVRRTSWVELEAGAELHVRLVVAEAALPGSTVLERLAMKRQRLESATPTIVASVPGGADYPPHVDPLEAFRRPRRVAAFAITAVAVLDLLSGVTPPISHRLHWITGIVPITVPQTATALTVLTGLGLLALASGVRRGQRHAWATAAGLLVLSTLAHLTKGLDVEEATVAVVALAYLLGHRRAFEGRTDTPSIVRTLANAVLGALAAVTVAIGFLVLGDTDLSLGRATTAVVERLVGITTVDIPGLKGRFLTPALAAVGIGLLLLVIRALFGPVRRQVHERTLAHGDQQARARGVVERHGGGTLDYFALRSDKEFFFHRDSLVAYAVHNGVALVSPDPIGPPAERRAVWTAFRRFADDHGWTVAVMAASERWLDVYRASGLHDLYIGDEAIVDTRRFSLEGGRNKGLRQAVNRVAKYGYRISFHDPATIDPALGDDLKALMVESRRGDVERGFSMTLGRIFDPADTGLLLAVAFGPDGAPAAFCQFVPAPAINGYSLDLMRRSAGDHPNGLTDFVIVETLRELERRGMTGLALNFATVRAVLAGEAGDGLALRVERWLAGQMSADMQIESLWRYNAKFDPEWRPRYAVFDAPEHMPAVALAVAKAESFWELPVIGRFLQPRSAAGPGAEAAPLASVEASTDGPADVGSRR